jgi:hypothetical protein
VNVSKLIHLCGVAALCGVALSARAAFVLPQIGGGQTGMMGAPMKHADIMFDGTNIAVHVDDTVATPWLRPLTPPNEFDPTKPWSVLIGRAYNFQYAWNPGGFISLPAGTWIWVERLHHDPGLEVYLRPPQWTSGPTWTELFTADGERWKWDGAMQHNAYAVLDPAQSVYTAEYRVYIGDIVTGEPVPGYGSADVTWTWNATVVPEPAALALLAPCAGLFLRRRRVV